MKYIKRTLEQKIEEISDDYSCLLLIGPRQVGKTTMLEHLMNGSDRRKVHHSDLDDIAGDDATVFFCPARFNTISS